MLTTNHINASELLLAPPLTPPFSHRGGVSAYGVRRWRKSNVTGFTRDLPSVHEGVDLVPALPDDEGAVYAAFWGEIVELRQHHDNSGNLVNEDLTLWCDPRHAGIIVNYLHIMRSKTFSNGNTVSSGVNKGGRVRAGQLLGFISPFNVDPHLHFELRVQNDTNSPFSGQPPLSTISIDPTQMLYRFDADRWPRSRNEQIEEWSMGGYLRISRLRIVPWIVQHQPHQVKWHTQRLLQVLFEEDPSKVLPGQQRFYLPVDVALPRERIMSDVLRDAFNTQQKVRLRGRRSWFFGDRLMIEDVSVRPG